MCKRHADSCHLSSLINVPFLNLMSNIVARGGTVRVRLGGNTQDQAAYAGDVIEGNFLRALSKEKVESGRVVSINGLFLLGTPLICRIDANSRCPVHDRLLLPHGQYL